MTFPSGIEKTPPAVQLRAPSPLKKSSSASPKCRPMPGIGCRGSRLIPVEANGAPAFGQYKPDPDGGLEPWSLQVVELSADGGIAGICFFLDTAHLFLLFGLPPHLDG